MSGVIILMFLLFILTMVALVYFRIKKDVNKE